MLQIFFIFNPPRKKLLRFPDMKPFKTGNLALKSIFQKPPVRRPWPPGPPKPGCIQAYPLRISSLENRYFLFS